MTLKEISSWWLYRVMGTGLFSPKSCEEVDLWECAPSEVEGEVRIQDRVLQTHCRRSWCQPWSRLGQRLDQNEAGPSWTRVRGWKIVGSTRKQLSSNLPLPTELWFLAGTNWLCGRLLHSKGRDLGEIFAGAPQVTGDSILAPLVPRCQGNWKPEDESPSPSDERLGLR